MKIKQEQRDEARKKQLKEWEEEENIRKQEV